MGKSVTVYISDDLIARLESASKKTLLSRSQLVRFGIELELGWIEKNGNVIRGTQDGGLGTWIGVIDEKLRDNTNTKKDID